MSARFYVATTLSNTDQAKIVIRRLSDFGHQVSYDWTVHGKLTDPKLMLDVAVKELEGVVTSDCVVVLWPGMRGTHVEIGAALATNKPIFFVTPTDFDADISFYHHPNITRFDSLDKAIEVIHKSLSVFESAMQSDE